MPTDRRRLSGVRTLLHTTERHEYTCLLEPSLEPGQSMGIHSHCKEGAMSRTRRVLYVLSLAIYAKVRTTIKPHIPSPRGARPTPPKILPGGRPGPTMTPHPHRPARAPSSSPPLSSPHLSPAPEARALTLITDEVTRASCGKPPGRDPVLASSRRLHHRLSGRPALLGQSVLLYLPPQREAVYAQ